MNPPRIEVCAEMFRKALDEAKARAPHTSRRHDYHDGAYLSRVDKYLAGCLGEEVFKGWLRSQGITPYRQIRFPQTPDIADVWIREAQRAMVNVKAELPGRKNF